MFMETHTFIRHTTLKRIFTKTSGSQNTLVSLLYKFTHILRN